MNQGTVEAFVDPGCNRREYSSRLVAGTRIMTLIDEGCDSRAGALGPHFKGVGIFLWSFHVRTTLHRWDLNLETGHRSWPPPSELVGCLRNNVDIRSFGI